MRIELTTPSLRVTCSAFEPRKQMSVFVCFGADKHQINTKTGFFFLVIYRKRPIFKSLRDYATGLPSSLRVRCSTIEPHQHKILPAGIGRQVSGMARRPQRRRAVSRPQQQCNAALVSATLRPLYYHTFQTQSTENPGRWQGFLPSAAEGDFAQNFVYTRQCILQIVFLKEFLHQILRHFGKLRHIFTILSLYLSFPPPGKPSKSSTPFWFSSVSIPFLPSYFY